MTQQEYFGEKIALYFEFMGHYTFWLLIPAIFGVPIQVVCWSENDYNTPGQVLYLSIPLHPSPLTCRNGDV
jgi:hypothetical protein